MNVNDDLLGKTITGVIAHRIKETGVREIWVLQFDDGSHIEFVSPGARKALLRASHRGRKSLPLQRLRDTAKDAMGHASKLTDSRSLHYQGEAENVVQLTLNVA